MPGIKSLILYEDEQNLLYSSLLQFETGLKMQKEASTFATFNASFLLWGLY